MENHVECGNRTIFLGLFYPMINKWLIRKLRALRQIVFVVVYVTLPKNPVFLGFFVFEISTPEEGELQLSLFWAMSTRVWRETLSWSHMTPYTSPIQKAYAL